MTKQKGKGYQGIGAIEVPHFSAKIQELASNIVLIERNEKQYIRLKLNVLGTQGTFSDEVTPDIYGFTDEPVVQCDIQVYRKYFCRLLQIDDTNNK